MGVSTNRIMANENFISKKLQPHFILSLKNVLNNPTKTYRFFTLQIMSNHLK